MAAAPLTRRDRAGVLAAIVVVWGLTFAPQIFAGRVFVLGDAAAYRPFAEFSRQRWLERHERTFWNPYVFTGLPATASLADPRPQYLPGPVLDAIERAIRLPGWPPLAGPLAGALLGMIGMALLARAVWQAGPTGMACAALAWGLMPNLVVPLAFGHDAQFLSASLMPAALLAVHHLFAATGRRAIGWAAVATALALGLQCLTGHPQIVVYTAALASAFALERALRFRRPVRLALAAGAAAAAASMSAAVWLPAYHYGLHSSRGGGVPLAEVAHFSHALRDLAALVWPWAVGFGDATYWGGLRATDYPQYLGATVVLLAVLAWPARRDPDRGTAALLVAVVAVAVALSLGTRLGPLYPLAAHLPFFSMFRVPVALMIVAQLAVALLAARAIDRGPAAAPPRVAWLLAAGLALAGLAVALGPLHDTYVGVATTARPGFGLAPAATAATRAGLDLGLRVLLAAGVVAMLARHRVAPRAPWSGAVLLALVACDLGSASLPLLHRATGRPETLAPPPPTLLAQVAAADPLGRALALDRASMLSNRWVSWRARSLAGEHAAVIRNWGDLMSRGLLGHYPALCALAVRYVAGDGSVRIDTSRCDPVFRDGRPLPVLRLRGALPRAYAVPRVVAPGNDEAVIAAVLDPRFEPAGVAFASDPEAAGEYPGSRDCVLGWIADEPDRIELAAAAPAPAFVVIADAHLPGWRVTLDGRPATLHRIDHLVRGVAVPAGRHRIAMRYEPEGWRAGMWSTRLTLVLLLVAAAALALPMPGRRTT